MKNIITRLALCTAIALVAIQSNANAQSQQEMNRQAARDFDAADSALNRVYKQLTDKLDKESQLKLKAVQRAWVQFRDAEAQFEADLEARGGTMAPLIYNGTRASLTKTRTKELQLVLKDYGR